MTTLLLIVLTLCVLCCLKVIFLEVICNDPKIIEANIERKTLSPDYAGMDKATVSYIYIYIYIHCYFLKYIEI